jgi:hypothetical protein
MSTKHTPVHAAPILSLQNVMRSAGWEIHYIDLDLTGERPKAEIKVARNDGRWLLARVDSLGRASVERFHRGVTLGMSLDTKGRRPLSPQVIDTFLGRTGYPGARSMLRELTGYIAHNALRPIALTDVRSAWASVMASPLRLENAAIDSGQSA